MEEDFVTIVPKGDISLTPNFTPSERLYEVILYDYNEQILINASLPYNADIGESLKNNVCSYYNYRAYTGSKSNYRYEFRGWQSEYDFYN
jgi:hypothetical protein